MDICAFWAAVLRQDRELLKTFFREDAWVNWHNTNERFTAAEFIRANCEYPGSWDGEVERVLELPGEVITVTRVHDKAETVSFHAVSFFRLQGDRIQSIDEYWGDDTQPPRWRQELGVGCPIRKI